jgi:HlyD family secretion protein
MHTVTYYVKNIWAKTWVRWAIGALAVVVVGQAAFGGAKTVEYETMVAEKGTVTETVITTGQIKPKQFASLSFKTTGTIARLSVEVGDTVAAGQVIAALDTGELSKKVLQAEADLVAARVTLENATQEVTDQLTKGDQSLELLYTAAPGTLNEILNYTQQAYTNFISFYDSSNRLTSDVATPILASQRVIDANAAFPIAQSAMKELQAAIESLPLRPTRAQVDTALAGIYQPLQQLQVSLASLINAIASIPTGSISASTLETYRSSLATARTNLNTAITKESDTVADIRDANVQNRLQSNTKQASERSAVAGLEKAKAALEIAKQSLAEAYLRSPITGVVAAKSKQLGELVTSADQVYYIIGEGGLKIVSNIPEVDIAKVSVGDEAVAVLDAYDSGTTFKVRISEIDPAETIVDGIATYKATFVFEKPDDRIRSGMTASIAIETERRDDVLRVPQRALITNNGAKFIRLPAGPEEPPREVAVQTGLRGSDGTIEIISGISAGDTIILGTK